MLRFVVIFGVLMGLFYAVTMTSYMEEKGWTAYLDFNAKVSGAILGFLGENVTVSGQLITSPRGSLLIQRGCDAIHPSALFISAVLALPVSVWRKLPGMAVGTVVLMITNLARIISLFYVQIHFPRAFEIMHIEVWQTLFIFFAVLLWAIWAWWAVSGGMVRANASS